MNIWLWISNTSFCWSCQLILIVDSYLSLYMLPLIISPQVNLTLTVILIWQAQAIVLSQLYGILLNWSVKRNFRKGGVVISHKFTVIAHTVQHHTTTTTVLRPFFRDHPGEPVPEEKLLDFMVQGKINRGRHCHTENPAGRHSIRTNQCPPTILPKLYNTERNLHALYLTVPMTLCDRNE